MATRLKTVEYAFPALASLTDAVLTNVTQITVYLPESGTKTFREVIVRWTCDDIITVTGGTINEFRTGLRLGAAAYTTVTNLNDIVNSGENISFQITADLTSHFTTNWTGASMTCDLQVYMDQSTGTTLNLVNVCATLEITYEYDDTSTTQVKTVYIPLDAPTGALATSKPGVANATIPALDTWLPERNKVYRELFVVAQGNEARNGATTDHTLSMQIDSLAALTSGNYEGALATDRWFRYVWDITGLGMTTNATHSFFIWASVARCNHMQAYLVVTYEFDDGGPVTTAWAASAAKSIGDKVYGTNASGKNIAFRCTTAGTTGGTQPTWNTTAGATTTDGTAVWTVLSVMNSLRVPMEFESPMGGNTSADYQRASIELCIQEPGTIADDYCALLLFWDQSGPIAGLNARVGTGAFTAYTDTAATLAGGNGAMLRCESALALARGRQDLQADIYRNDTADLGWMTTALWMINYSSGQHRDGVGAHNHTVCWSLTTFSTVAPSTELLIAATAPNIPETSYHLMAGLHYMNMTNSTTPPSAIGVQAERLSGEGGIKWEALYGDSAHTDPEVGVHQIFAMIPRLFRRWPSDAGAGRLDIETARRWRIALSNGAAAFHNLDLLLNYHSITCVVTGNVTGSSGGTVTLNLCRDATGERVLSTTRSGNGAYSFTWYCDTDTMFVEARESAALLGRSDSGTAS
jgi:hypothetical protein